MASLAEASLSGAERRVLDRLVNLLERELGDELLAVWLFGSRARGERPGPDSDVDLIVVVRLDPESHRVRVHRLVDAAAGGEGASPVPFIVHISSPDRLAERRAIRSFFMDEVDRDKVVLFGDPSGGAPTMDDGDGARGGGGLSPRSAEFMDMARSRLRAARQVLDAGDPSASVGLAYYASLYAARAALSEENLYARTHRGTWDLFRQTFVAAGRFDEDTLSQARDAQATREDADYDAVRIPAGQAKAVYRGAERFVEAVAAMLGA